MAPRVSFEPSWAGENRVFMRGFRGTRIRGGLDEIEPQHGPAVKSRSLAHRTKCEKSLNGKVFRAANESFL
jgi:hypothetical protein